MVDEETGFKIFELRGHFQANPFNVRVKQVFKNAPSRNLFGMKGVFKFFGPLGLKFFVGIRWGLFASLEWQSVLKITLYLSDCKLC